MGKRKTIVTALSGVLVGGMLLSGGLVFAGDTDSSVSNNLTDKMPFFGQAMKDRGGMGNRYQQHQLKISDSLKTLMEEGTLTKDQSDKILKQFEDAQKNHEALREKMERVKPQNPLSQLVEDGTITHEQADAFQATMRETAQKINQQRVSDSFKELVEKGTITQEQSDKILKKLEDAQKDREALFEKMQSMTMEERRQYMQDNKEKPQDFLSQLVADATITEDQAKAIGDILPHRKGGQGGLGGQGFKGFNGGRR